MTQDELFATFDRIRDGLLKQDVHCHALTVLNPIRGEHPTHDAPMYEPEPPAPGEGGGG